MCCNKKTTDSVQQDYFIILHRSLTTTKLVHKSGLDASNFIFSNVWRAGQKTLYSLFASSCCSLPFLQQEKRKDNSDHSMKCEKYQWLNEFHVWGNVVKRWSLTSPFKLYIPNYHLSKDLHATTSLHKTQIFTPPQFSKGSKHFYK